MALTLPILTLTLPILTFTLPKVRIGHLVLTLPFLTFTLAGSFLTLGKVRRPQKVSFEQGKGVDELDHPPPEDCLALRTVWFRASPCVQCCCVLRIAWC